MQPGSGKFGNDVSWYKHYPILTENVAKVFMSRPNGVDYATPLKGFNSGTVEYQKQGGFLGIVTMPTFGATGSYTARAVDPAAALNTAASKLYYYVVHGNSRNISYDKSDLIKAYLAYDGVACILTEAIRAYSFIKAVSVKNRWVKQIVNGLGWDYDNLMANQVEMRKVINNAILKFNQISLPDVFDIYKCHTQLYEKVYMDRANGKPQFMACISDGAWVYLDEYSEVNFMREGVFAGGAHWNWNPANGLRKVSDLRELVNSAINAIYDSTDIGVIQGDLKRAFGENQMLSMAMIEDEPEIPLVYDPEFNLSIHNLEMSTKPFDITTKSKPTDAVALCHTIARIGDDAAMSGNLDFVMFSSTSADWYGLGEGRHAMDLTDEWTEDVDAIIIAQKFKLEQKSTSETVPVHVMEPDTTTSAVRFISCGPFIVTRVLYNYDVDKKNPYPENITGRMEIDAGRIGANVATKLFELAVTLPFYTYSGNTTSVCSGMTWEVGNLTYYDDATFRWIQNSMIESLWYNDLLYNRS